MSKCRQEFDPEGFKRIRQYFPLSDDPEYNAQVEANEPIISILTQIRDLLALIREDSFYASKASGEEAQK